MTSARRTSSSERGAAMPSGVSITSLLGRLHRTDRAVRAVAISVLVLAVALVDWFTGPDISMVFPQALVVVVAAWVASPGAVGAAVVVMVGATAAGRVDAGGVAGVVVAINVVLRSGALGVVAVTTIALRRHVLMLEALAYRDELTGALSRPAFVNALAQELDRAARFDGTVSLAYLDLDDLKRLNDVHGHAAGDRRLRDFASAVQARIRPYDVLGRLGGDEFAIVFPATSRQDALAVLDRLAQEPAVGAVSIGVVADEPGSRATAADLLARADAAMYDVKKRRRASLSRPTGGVGRA